MRIMELKTVVDYNCTISAKDNATAGYPAYMSKITAICWPALRYETILVGLWPFSAVQLLFVTMRSADDDMGSLGKNNAVDI